MNTITIEQLMARLKADEPLQLIDVRSAGEFRAGHLPGAVNVPLESIAARAGDLSSQQPVILVCQRGQRASLAYKQLQGRFHPLAVLAGGTQAWMEAGLPIRREQATGWSLERQVRLTAGVLVLAGTLGSLAWPPALALAVFIGGGLSFSGMTNWCGMALLLAKMPWNRVALPAAGTPLPTLPVNP